MVKCLKNSSFIAFCYKILDNVIFFNILKHILFFLRKKKTIYFNFPFFPVFHKNRTIDHPVKLK